MEGVHPERVPRLVAHGSDLEAALAQKPRESLRREEAPVPGDVIAAPQPTPEQPAVEAVDVGRLDGEEPAGREPADDPLHGALGIVDVLDHVEHRDEIHCVRRQLITVFDARAHRPIPLGRQRGDGVLVELESEEPIARHAAALDHAKVAAVTAADIEIRPRRGRAVLEDPTHLPLVEQGLGAKRDRGDLLVVVGVVVARVDDRQRGQGGTWIQPDMAAEGTPHEPPFVPAREHLVVEAARVRLGIDGVADGTGGHGLLGDLRRPALPELERRDHRAGRDRRQSSRGNARRYRQR